MFIYLKIFIVLFIIFAHFYFKINQFKICLCVIGKNENLYIKEFIKYYKKIGYTHIFLYDNNDIDDENFEEVIQKDISKGFVSIVNFRGYRGLGINPQLKAYQDCYDKNYKKYNWLSFFDIDEFLELKPNNMKLINFFNQKRFNLCKVIKLNWLYYVNNKETLYYENTSLLTKMTKPLYNLKINRHIKSTVRGNLPQNYWSKVENPHTSINNYTTCSSSGKIINSSSPYNTPVEHEFAYLKHYQIKSFEEYCMKIKRGRPISGYKIFRKNMIFKLIQNNINNTEKLLIIKKIFNISLYDIYNISYF